MDQIAVFENIEIHSREKVKGLFNGHLLQDIRMKKTHGKINTKIKLYSEPNRSLREESFC